MPETRPLVQCKQLVKTYRGGGPFGSGSSFRAVDRVDLALHTGRTLALVGESGCGKSTLGRLLLALDSPSSGSVAFEGRDLAGLSSEELRRTRARMQMVFQDPLGSLNPRFSVFRTLAEPLTIHEKLGGSGLKERVASLLEMVGLAPEHAVRYPHEFSGGQRQRIAIARAIAVHPAFIVADEPVSALDISIQGQILNLLLELKQRLSLALLFISHDMAVVRSVSDRVAVMFRGRIVELAPTDLLYSEPRHPYTRLLLRSAGAEFPGDGHMAKIIGTVGYTGGNISGREVETIPDLVEVAPDHWVAV